MFTEKYQNVSIENIKFEKNAVCLIKRNVSSTGNTTTEVLTFANCPDTKETTIVKHLLKGLLAEFHVCGEFNSQFSTFATGATVNGQKEVVKTGIVARRKFSAFLRTSTIFKTDSEGKLSKAIVCSEDTKLSDTALNIKDTQLLALTSYNSNQFRSALHHTSLAILAQCTMYNDIANEINAIDEALTKQASEESKQATKQPTKQASKKAS